MDHGRVGPPGVLGGEAGQPNRIEIRQGGKIFVPVHLSKDQDIQLRAGDLINVQTPGGGGYGSSSDRPAKLSAKDAKHGYRAFTPASGARADSVAKLKAAE
jgi:N-methylhydantoinase B